MLGLPMNSTNRHRRPRIEDAACLDLQALMSADVIVPGQARSGVWLLRNDSITYTSKLDCTQGVLTVLHDWVRPGRRYAAETAYDIRLVTTPCRFGGWRWWLLCPSTGRKVMKLYRVPTAEKFCCRVAMRPQPIYHSQRCSELDGIFAKRWKLRRLLNDDSNLFSVIERKPKWMRRTTFDDCQGRDLRLALQARELMAKILGIAVADNLPCSPCSPTVGDG
jgi:hypothetical protein